MKRLALIFSFIFVVIHAYSAFNTKVETISFKTQYSTTASVSDSLALVALYIQCNGEKWTKKDNWLTGRLDTWQGVVVQNGRVVELDLGDQNASFGLKGQLPSELSNLTEIRVLCLDNNKLTGTLPDNWTSLSKLQDLYLHNNNFTGTLPTSWSVLGNLRELILYNNQLTGSLPDSWSKLVKLENLQLLQNNLSGSIPDSWTSLVNLTQLLLSYNELSGSLPENLSYLVKLTSLWLNDNKFIGTLPDSWSSLVKLTQVLVSNNQLSGLIPISWVTLTNLENLQLSNNKFLGLMPLSKFTKLDILYTENNSLDFGSIEPNIGIPKNTFSYSPQADIGKKATITKNVGEEFKISVNVGGQSNKYQWFKDGILISGATNAEYVIPSVTISDAANYSCQITNTVATQLTLASNPITLHLINDVFDLNTDSLALVALYKQCNGLNWTKKDNWLKGRLDTWQGVYVENGRVVSLNLGDQTNSVGLTGQLPDELSNLTMIRSIDLGWNNLTGTLPESWSSLLKLQHLWLQNNQIIGSLPGSWSTLTNLTDLNLIYNQISGSLPVSWSTLVNLKYLRLDENKLSGNLPIEWSSLINLSFLGLANNQISGSLPAEWSTLVKLVNIELWENKISGILPESWASLVNLQRIDLGSNQLPGNQREGIKGTLPESWSTLKELQWLNLSGNQLSGNVPESWKAMTKLAYLALNNNQIFGLPAFSTLSNLEYMDVGMNLLDFGDIEPNIGIPKMNFNYSPQAPIGQKTTITKNSGEEFRISATVGGTSNKYQWFKDGILISGATSSEYVIPSVTISDAANYTCQITNTVATQLTLTSNPITLQVLNNVFDLNTDSLALVALYNQCNGPNWTRNKNWMTGRLVTWQGVFLENGRVIGLELSDNSNPANSVGLTGNLPAELTNLTAIQFFNFRNNKLTGNLPESWSVFRNLKTIYLHENQFSGNLPESWSAMESLIYLGLDKNNLTGTLPTTWSTLQNLEIISLNYNHLSGDLPVNWSLLNKMKLISLGDNQLIGTLPKSWSSLENLEALGLWNNQLTGNLPDEWKTLLKIWSIDISGNQLTGNLPDSWSSLIKLRDIKLYSNQITGTLPESWSSFTDMMQLMLNNNQLSGSYPESWKTFSNLQYLYLNDNQIADLPELSSYPLLDTLSVENNRLDFGDIEPNVSIPSVKYTYSPQAKIGLTDTIAKKSGEEFRISVVVGGQSNKYQWYKNGIIITGANETEFIIPSVTTNDASNYTCQITNTVATQLTLTSNPITLRVQEQVFSANAGPDQIVNEGKVVSLDGSLSYDPDGNPLTFIWTVSSGISLSSVSTSKPTFIAPEIERDTTYTFSLVVNNGTLDSPADQVLITVLNVNKAPKANAGMDQLVMTGEMGSLDGSASNDPDGNQLIYKWTAPDGIILSSASESMPTFTIPEVTSDTIYTFSLVVNDGLIDSPMDQVMIKVIHADKQLLVNAGPDQYVYERTNVYLDGSASTFLNKKSLTYNWTCPPEISLNSLTDEKPSFKAPEVSETTKYTFSLVVNDGTSSSIIDRVNIYVVDEIRIYPNITTGIVNIEFNIAANRETEVLVVNLTGTVLLRNKVNNPSKFQLDLSRFADETYVIIVNYDDKHYSCKVILRK